MACATLGALVAVRVDRLLGWRAAYATACALVVFYAVAWSYLTLTGPAPLTRMGGPIGGDFIAFHTAGRFLLQGRAAQLYDKPAVRDQQRETMVGLLTPYVPFRNPPFFALPFALLALLDLVPSYLVWMVLGVIGIAVAVWRVLPQSLQAHRREVLVLAFAFTPVYLGLGGNTAPLALLLWVLVYRALHCGKDVEAGMWAAFGLFKPQLFILLPVVFLLTRRWRALGVYAAVATVLGLVSLGVVGVEGMRGWVQVMLSSELEGSITAHFGLRMHGLKAFFDLLWPGVPALVGTIVASGVVLCALVHVWLKSIGPLSLRIAFTMVAALLVNPHLFDYDLTLLVLVGILVGHLVRAKWWFLAGYVLLLIRAPIPLGESYLQLTVLLFMGFGCWLYRQILSAGPEAALQA